MSHPQIFQAVAHPSYAIGREVGKGYIYEIAAAYQTLF